MKIMNIDKTSIIITLFILIILVMASPTQAEINVVDPPLGGYEVNLSDAFEFDITMDKVTDIDSFVINISLGTDSIECGFDRHGNNLKKDHDNNKTCKGIKIRKPGHEYGYGYGYGHDNVYKYRIRIETNKGFINEKGTGTYTIILKIEDDDDGTSFKLTVSDPDNGNNGNGNSNDNGNNNNDNGNNGNGNNGDNGNNGNGKANGKK